MHPKVPAVVVGGSLNGLGVVRSLARHSIPVYVLDTNRRCPAAWSRYCRFVHTRSLEGEPLLETLSELAGRLGCRPALILTLDPSVMTIAAAQARMRLLYRFDLPDASTVSTLSDKLRFQDWAQREGLPVPRSCALREPADLPELQTLTPPLVLKPADKRLVLEARVERALRAESVEVAQRLATGMLQRAPALIAQEWIEGPDTEIYFTLFCTDRTGRAAALFCGRKLVCSPPSVGSTAACMAAPQMAEALGALTESFIERARYRGLGSLEFKRDIRTGALMIVEPTVGRTDWQEEIATLSGVNLPFLAYQTALDEEPEAQHPVERRLVWRSERRFKVPAEFSSGAQIVDGPLRWGDPLPGIFHYGYERLLARLGRRAAYELRRTFFLVRGGH